MVKTLDEILKEHDELTSRQLPPATNDPLCHFVETVECEWWGWHELQREVNDESN